MKKRYQKLSGWWRLKFGFCPMCDSSPPRNECPVCGGSYKYGHYLDKTGRKLWWDRYLFYVERGLP